MIFRVVQIVIQDGIKAAIHPFIPSTMAMVTLVGTKAAMHL